MSEQVVVGVGNPTMSDDGVGHRIVDAIEESDDCPASVDLHRTATSSFLALEALSGADRAVVVDAIDVPDARPGTVHRYQITDGTPETGAPDVLMHDLSFSHALQAGREAYDIPREITVIGVQPACVSVGLDLSDPVTAAVSTAVDAVLDALDAAETATEPTRPME
jgi:hydrogenase maturation protease